MSLMPAVGAQVFYLTDLALYPQAHRRMFEVDDTPMYQLLYLQTAYRQRAMQGPLLISPSTSRAEDMLAGWVAQGVAIAIHSGSPFSDSVDHWRGLAQIRRQAGPAALFRYADPRLYAGLESALSQGEINRLLGPAYLMHGVAADHAWQLESSEGPPPASSDDEFVLTAAHERAMQSWRERLLSRQLADEHALPEACVTTWLEQMKELALPTEYAQWEGCRTLAEAGCRLPLTPRQVDDLQRHAVPWQQRLAQLREMAVTSPHTDKVDS